MKKQAVISIFGQQSSNGQPEPPFELITDGCLLRHNDKSDIYSITYHESELTGLGDTETTLTVEPGCFTVLRNGEFPGQFTFELGRRHVSLFEIPEVCDGVMTLAFTTKTLTSSLTDDGGDVDVSYSIDMNGIRTSSNTLHINVRALPQ